MFSFYQKGTYVYDFSGSGSDVGSWRDMTDGCADKGATGNTINSNEGCGSDPWLRTFFNLRLSRFQNSVVSYDKYIILYGFNCNHFGLYQGPTNGIMYLNVETEQWHYPYNQAPSGWPYSNGWMQYKEKSKYFILKSMQLSFYKKNISRNPFSIR